MTCTDCGEELTRKPGRGRSPKRCTPCQSKRRAKRKAKLEQHYRDVARDQLHVSVSDVMIAAAIGYGEAWHIDIGREIPGTRGRHGAVEGHTTGYKDLAGILDTRAAVATRDPWWDEHPGVWEGLW